jgi:hypothetical protein
MAPAARLGIDVVDVCKFDIDIGRRTKNVPQGKTNVAWCQLRDGGLVEQRFELLVVVMIDESDTDLAAARQVLGTFDARKAATNNYYVFNW